MRPKKLEDEAEGYTFGSVVAFLVAIASAAIYADEQRAPALVVAVGFAVLAITAARRRAALLKKAEDLRALEKAGL